MPDHPERLPQDAEINRDVYHGLNWNTDRLVYQYLAEKFTGALGLWIFDKWYRFVGLYDCSFIHEHDPIGNLFGEPHFVGDTNHRHATFGQVDQNITDAGETKYDIYEPGLSE